MKRRKRRHCPNQLTVQLTDSSCHAAFASVEKPNNRFNLNSDEVLVRISLFLGPSQQFKSAPLASRISTALVLFYFSCLSRWGSNIWLPVKVVARVSYGQCCLRYGTRISLLYIKSRSRQKDGSFKCSFAEVSLKDVGMDIVRTLSITKRRNPFFLFMTDRVIKLTKAIRTPMNHATTAARIVLEHCMDSFLIPSKLITDNGPQFVPNVFVVVCITLRVWKFTNPEYPQQSSGQAEQFNYTIVLRLHHNVSEHQKNWESCLLPRTYI